MRAVRSPRVGIIARERESRDSSESSEGVGIIAREVIIVSVGIITSVMRDISKRSEKHKDN